MVTAGLRDELLRRVSHQLNTNAVLMLALLCILYSIYIVYIGIYIVGIYILIYRTTRGRLGSTNRPGRRLIAISLLVGPMTIRFDCTT